MVDCCHALQTKKEQSQAAKIKEDDGETGEETTAGQSCEAPEEAGPEEACEEEGRENSTGP